MVNMHIPMRMCIACRQMKPKRELIRIIQSDGQISVDYLQKIQTSGAYICPDTECVNMAIKKKALERKFKRAVDKSVYDSISEAAEKFEHTQE